MPQIAKLDDNGMLIGVEACCADDHKTCPVARTVALPDEHDMRGRLKSYRWDFGRGCFLPLSAEPLDAADRDTPELVEGLVQAIEHIEQLMQLDLPKRSKRALRNYRRLNPGSKARGRHRDNRPASAAATDNVPEGSRQ
ncbi:MAG: hypothetical protein IPK78_18970 [Rhodospirillales bacterium]|nr:hypothetical protein [Rhodospirillales bacterium]